MNRVPSTLGAVFALVLALALPASAQSPGVVINEIMYHPPDDRDGLQFVELFNAGSTAADLSGWKFSKGLQFAFAPGTTLQPNAYLVVCREMGQFQAQYGKDIPVVGPFQGNLSHNGERVELSNAANQVVDGLKYEDGGEWPIGPDGFSASLERICPAAPGDDPLNWAGSSLPARRLAGGSPGKQNQSFSPNPLPAVQGIQQIPKAPKPGEAVTVQAEASDLDGVKAVWIALTILKEGGASAEQRIVMQRTQGDDRKGSYRGIIPVQTANSLVRFRIEADDGAGMRRSVPSLADPRPSFSYFVPPQAQPARIPIGLVYQYGPNEAPGPSLRNQRTRPATASTQGNAAFIYVSPEGVVQTFDHVRVTPRSSGFKVRFFKDQPLNQMSTINVIFEASPRQVLSEALAYEVFRRAGVPAPHAEHIRIYRDGVPAGYHLLVEQPNRTFLKRNERDDSGNLYKLLWYGRHVIEKHEKKTNPGTGHQDVIQLIDGLNRSRGAQQWDYIQKHFNVEEFINYFAVNMCIQNWDGFFNNYFVYHDTGGTGKWEIYPWDEDKTWGDFDGAGTNYDWYELPLTYGMNGDQSPSDFRSRFNRGPFGGVSWWRPPGYFSGPLLANAEFRKRFLVRLQELCETVFAEAKFLPVINIMEKRLEPEIPIWAQTQGISPSTASRMFLSDMESFRRQLVNRRKFILEELARMK